MVSKEAAWDNRSFALMIPDIVSTVDSGMKNKKGIGEKLCGHTKVYFIRFTH